jgi:hypothetical protein
MIFVQSQANGMFWNGVAFAAPFAEALPVTTKIGQYLAWMSNAIAIQITVDG